MARWRPEGWLFLDEPTSALDLYYQQHLLRLLKRLTRSSRLHVCIVLHDLNLAALWADRILLLYQGKLVAEGTPQEVIQQPIISRWYGAEVSMGNIPMRPFRRSIWRRELVAVLRQNSPMPANNPFPARAALRRATIRAVCSPAKASAAPGGLHKGARCQ